MSFFLFAEVFAVPLHASGRSCRAAACKVRAGAGHGVSSPPHRFLEDRRMLSLSCRRPTDSWSIMRLPASSESATTASSGESTATDPAGDFVVIWAQNGTCLPAAKPRATSTADISPTKRSGSSCPARSPAPMRETPFDQFTCGCTVTRGTSRRFPSAAGTNPGRPVLRPSPRGNFGLTYDDPTAANGLTGDITFSQATAPAIKREPSRPRLNNATNTGGSSRPISAALAGVQVVALIPAITWWNFPRVTVTAGQCHRHCRRSGGLAGCHALAAIGSELPRSFGFLPGVLVSDYQEPSTSDRSWSTRPLPRPFRPPPAPGIPPNSSRRPLPTLPPTIPSAARARRIPPPCRAISIPRPPCCRPILLMSVPRPPTVALIAARCSIQRAKPSAMGSGRPTVPTPSFLHRFRCRWPPVGPDRDHRQRYYLATA